MIRTDNIGEMLLNIKDCLHVDLTREAQYIDNIGISIEEGMQGIVVSVCTDDDLYKCDSYQHFNQYGLPIKCLLDELAYIRVILENSGYKVNFLDNVQVYFAGMLTGTKPFEKTEIYELVGRYRND